jgi:hypothetical protein
MEWKRGSENGEFEVIQSILCRELLDPVYIATPLILSQYVSGTQLKHSGISISLSQCVYVFTYLLYTLLRNSITVPRAQIRFHRWVSDEWINRACLCDSGTGLYLSVAPLQFSFYCWASHPLWSNVNCCNIMLSWISYHESSSGSEADDDAVRGAPWRSCLTFDFQVRHPRCVQ